MTDSEVRERSGSIIFLVRRGGFPVGLLAWFHGRGATVLVPKITMLTVLERRRIQRARRAAAVREAVDRFFEAQMRFLDADDLDAIEAAGRDLASAAAELQMLHEFPGH